MLLAVEKLCAATVLAFGFSNFVFAGPVEEAVAAYNRGDYTNALQLIRPLAEKGIPRPNSVSDSPMPEGKACHRRVVRQRNGIGSPPIKEASKLSTVWGAFITEALVYRRALSRQQSGFSKLLLRATLKPNTIWADV